MSSLAQAGYDLDSDLMAAKEDVMKLTFAPLVNRAFIVRRSDDGLVLKWREAAASHRGSISSPNPRASGEKSSPGKAAHSNPSASGDYCFVMASESVQMAKRTWAFRFDKVVLRGMRSGGGCQQFLFL